MANKGFADKVAQWMRGRNGSDELATFALAVALFLVIINVFVRALFLSLVALALMGYAWWRMSSKNIEARENENGVFVEFIGPLRPWLRNPTRAFAEARAYKHLKCPECGQRVRVPRGKGRIRVKCPQCNQRFEAKS